MNITILFVREEEEMPQAGVYHRVAGSLKEEEEEMGILRTLAKLEVASEALLSR